MTRSTWMSLCPNFNNGPGWFYVGVKIETNQILKGWYSNGSESEVIFNSHRNGLYS